MPSPSSPSPSSPSPSSPSPSSPSSPSSDRVISAERVIAAPASDIFAILADPRRHADIDGSGTVKAADVDGPSRLSLGAKFGMSMKLGVKYRMVNTVTEFEEDRRIAWAPKPEVRGKEKASLAGRIWRYELEPVEGGTRVRETWDATNEKAFVIVKLVGGPGRTRAALEKTLERLAALVEG